MAEVNTTEQQKKNQLPEEMHQTNILVDRNVNQPPAVFVTEFRSNDIFQATRTVFSEENVCPPTSLNRHIVKIDCIYNKLKVTIYLYVSLVKIHPFLNEIGC